MTGKRFQAGLPTRVALGTVAGTGLSGVLEFANIPQNYRHLLAVYTGRSTAATTNDESRLTFEVTPTAGAYDRQRHYGSAGTAGADHDIGVTNALFLAGNPDSSSPANVMKTVQIFIPEYARTDIFKSVSSFSLGGGGNSPLGSGGLGVNYVTGVWESTAAIDRIRLLLMTGNWTTTTRATLYGIR